MAEAVMLFFDEFEIAHDVNVTRSLVTCNRVVHFDDAFFGRFALELQEPRMRASGLRSLGRRV